MTVFACTGGRPGWPPVPPAAPPGVAFRPSGRFLSCPRAVSSRPCRGQASLSPLENPLMADFTTPFYFGFKNRSQAECKTIFKLTLNAVSSPLPPPSPLSRFGSRAATGKETSYKGKRLAFTQPSASRNTEKINNNFFSTKKLSRTTSNGFFATSKGSRYLHKSGFSPSPQRFSFHY